MPPNGTVRRHDTITYWSPDYASGYCRPREVHVDVDGLDLTTAYPYDMWNRVLTETDPRGFTTGYAYDNVNRTVTVTTPSTGTATGPSQYQTVSTYDVNGNLTQTDRLSNDGGFTTYRSAPV